MTTSSTLGAGSVTTTQAGAGSATSTSSQTSPVSTAPLPTGAHALPLSQRGPPGAQTAATATLAHTLAATLDHTGTAAERSENAQRFAAIAATWHEPIAPHTRAGFAALDALRSQVTAARAVATPAGLAAAAAVAREVEQRSFAASKTLSSDWKEGQAVGRAHAHKTAAHLADLAARGVPVSEGAIATLNRMVRPDTKENARGVAVGDYRKAGVSKETAFLQRCVPPRHVGEAMQTFVDVLVDAEAQGMHPIERAGRAYHGLVNIHAFSDGNGRTSRAVMDWILQAAGFPPVALDDPKVLSFDTATRTTTPGMAQKAVDEVVAALTRQLTATLAALTTPASSSRPTVPLQEGAVAFENRGYVFLDVPRALRGATIEAQAGGAGGARQFVFTADTPLFIAVAPSQHPQCDALMQAAGFTRTKHAFRYSDKAKTAVEVWRRDVRAGDVVDVPDLGWAGARRIIPAPPQAPR